MQELHPRVQLFDACHSPGWSGPGLSDRMLSERLKELEHEGIVLRRVIPSTPVRVEYHVTDKGRALAGVMESIGAWADAWLKQPEAAKAAEPAP